jgi:two-component system chemotaxis response regulator CheB
VAARLKTHPRVPVIFFSSLTRVGAEATLDALALGANDYVTKPSAQDLRSATAQLGEQLFPKIRALVARQAERPEAAPAPVQLAPRPAGAPGRLELLVIGTSTGGPNALGDLIPALPASFPVPVVVVQHMPPMFTRLLAERLAARAAIPVHEVADGQPLLPGQAYLAPGDFHLQVERRAGGFVARLDQAPPENSCRPSVDVLFRSVAREVGPAALGVILTGMGKDGLAGSQAMRDRGARILAQDEASSVVWGMPGYVARAGLAEAVLPLSQFADELLRRFPSAGAPPARR